MDPNLVSATLSTEDIQVITGALDTLRQKLPFLVDLTTEQRTAMAKLGDKTQAFVQKAVEIANEHQDLFAPAFLDEMRKDARLLVDLSPIRLALGTIAKKIDDTTMQLGGEAFAAARTVYAVTKTPYAKAVMRTASDDLSKRYGRSRGKKKNEVPVPATAEPVTATEPASSAPVQH